MTDRFPYSFSKLLIFYVCWWAFWSIVQAVVLHQLGLDWYIASIDALISNFFLAVGGYIIILVYSSYLPRNDNKIYHFIFGITITVLLSFGVNKSLVFIFPKDEFYRHFLLNSISVRFIFSLLVIYFIILLNWLWNTLQEQKENLKRKTDSEKLMKEAELIKLRQQLQPHFLFNSLNSISALTTAQPLEARKMVVQLSEFLRGTLKQEDHLITLNEELDHLKLYLDIEKIRFGHRLTVDFDASEESMNQLLPSLLLLPLVENSIKFGLYDTVGEIKITIACNMTPNYLLIQIQNPFDKKNTSPLPGTGYGLSSIHRRLYLLYARQDLLLTHTDESIFTTSLKIPIA